MNNTYNELKKEILNNTKHIEIKHMTSYEKFEAIEGTYKGKEFKVSYGREFGQYTYNINYGDNIDSEIAELMQVLYIMGVLDKEVADEWSDMTILKK